MIMQNDDLFITSQGKRARKCRVDRRVIMKSGDDDGGAISRVTLPVLVLLTTQDIFF